MATSLSKIGICRECDMQWVIEGKTAVKTAVAAMDKRQFGDRCPFCSSNNVHITREKGTMTI